MNGKVSAEGLIIIAAAAAKKALKQFKPPTRIFTFYSWLPTGTAIVNKGLEPKLKFLQATCSFSYSTNSDSAPK